MEHDNLFIQILEILSIKYTKDFTLRFYEKHPHKNSLFGLSEMLRYYKIENVAAEIQKTQECLSSLDVPFVAYVDHEFVLVRHVSTEAIIYSWRGKNITLSIPVFLERWSGIVLLFESTDESIEPDYKEHRKEYLRLRIVIACFVSLLLSLIGCALITNRGMEIGTWGLWGVNVIGASFCGILLFREILGSDKYVNKICSLFLKSSDCNGTLDSQASHFLGISWSVFGLGYFLSAILFIALLPQYVIYAETLNIIALPYTAWSVWYQKFRVKQWCALCLSVQATVWITFLISLFAIGMDFNQWDLFDFTTIGCVYGLVILSLHFTVTLYVKEKQIQRSNNKLSSIKLNASVFKSLLNEQPQYDIDKNTGILLGNRDAKEWITIISNPHCTPCAKLHLQIEKLLKEYKEEICIQIILTSFSKELEPSAMLLTSMYLLNNESDYLRFLSDWYAKGRHKKEDCYKRYRLNPNDKDIFVDGDINDLLSGIDDLLFKKLVFGNMESRYSLSQLIHFLYYIYKRLEIQTNDNERFPFEGLAIKLVNQLADLIDASFFEESYTFSIYQYHVPILMKTLSCLIQYDFYKDRIQKVLEQLSLYMFSHLPHLHLNRLYLLWGILPLRNCSPDWQRYVNELRKSINLDIIYNREIKGKDIYISNGYASLYFLLEGLKRDFPEYTIPFNPHLIYDRIISSDAWDALMENEYYYNIHRGLLNGFPGTVLALLNIK